MFSPYYAWARRRGSADPLDHCAVNLALYGPRGDRWAMTERGRGSLTRDARHLQIGPSALTWSGDCLTVRVDEVTVPLPSRLRGTIRLYPEAFTGQKIVLDTAGCHHWWPVAPRARVELDLEKPALNWHGSGYFDSNAGTLPLEASFARWDWARAHLGRGAALLYNARERSGARTALALHVGADGVIEEMTPPPAAPLPGTLWRIARGTQAEAPGAPRVLRTLEDGPFYARSLLATRLMGEDVIAVHESLDLDRFRKPWVRALLPFRMPRRG